MVQSSTVPCVDRRLVFSIPNEEILELESAFRAAKDWPRRVGMVDRPSLGIQLKQVAVERVALVAEDHQSTALRAAEGIKVFVTTAMKPLKIQIGFFNYLVL